MTREDITAAARAAAPILIVMLAMQAFLGLLRLAKGLYDWWRWGDPITLTPRRPALDPDEAEDLHDTLASCDGPWCSYSSGSWDFDDYPLVSAMALTFVATLWISVFASDLLQRHLARRLAAAGDPDGPPLAWEWASYKIATYGGFLAMFRLSWLAGAAVKGGTAGLGGDLLMLVVALAAPWVAFWVWGRFQRGLR